MSNYEDGGGGNSSKTNSQVQKVVINEYRSFPQNLPRIPL